jgi:hypothetical protein
MSQIKKKISKIYALHYFKLITRSALFLLSVLFYILGRAEILTDNIVLPSVVWIFFVIGMMLRLFPSKFESMGCQKQFKRNYEPISKAVLPEIHTWKRTMVVALAWFLLNGVIGALYFFGILDKGELVLIAIFYSVCDVICILFFCPFQTWFMKNRCCTTCRIYNWDFAMMFTPLVFIPHWYTYSLLGLALLILLKWEITYRVHPERFSPSTNRCLDCSRCEEKLCSHKRQLRGFIQKYRTRFFPSRTNSKRKL